MDSCDRFIEELIELCQRRGTAARARAGWKLVTTVWKNLKSDTDARSLPVDGFKPELVANGQLGQALRHFRLHAGCILLGPPGWLLSAALEMLDLYQAKQLGRAESQTELEDNVAGREAGHLMAEAFAGQRDAEETRAELRKALGALPATVVELMVSSSPGS